MASMLDYFVPGGQLQNAGMALGQQSVAQTQMPLAMQQYAANPNNAQAYQTLALANPELAKNLSGQQNQQFNQNQTAQNNALLRTGYGYENDQNKIKSADMLAAYHKQFIAEAFPALVNVAPEQRQAAYERLAQKYKADTGEDMIDVPGMEDVNNALPEFQRAYQVMHPNKTTINNGMAFTQNDTGNVTRVQDFSDTTKDQRDRTSKERAAYLRGGATKDPTSVREFDYGEKNPAYKDWYAKFKAKESANTPPSPEYAEQLDKYNQETDPIARERIFNLLASLDPKRAAVVIKGQSALNTKTHYDNQDTTAAKNADTGKQRADIAQQVADQTKQYQDGTLAKQNATREQEWKIHQDNLVIKQQQKNNQQGQQYFTKAHALSTDYAKDTKIYKNVIDISDEMDKLYDVSKKQNTGIAGNSLITFISKLKDPSTGVLQGETESVAGAISLIDKLMDASMGYGGIVPDYILKDIMQSAHTIRDSLKEKGQQVHDAYAGKAVRYGLNPQDVVDTGEKYFGHSTTAESDPEVQRLMKDHGLSADEAAYAAKELKAGGGKQ